MIAHDAKGLAYQVEANAAAGEENIAIQDDPQAHFRTESTHLGGQAAVELFVESKPPALGGKTPVTSFSYIVDHKGELYIVTFECRDVDVARFAHAFNAAAGSVAIHG